MRPAPFDVIQPDILGVEEKGIEDGYHRRVIRTDRGPVETRLYQAPGATAGVICVGGVGGGFDTPAQGLYPKLGEELSAAGFKVLRVKFRDPTHLGEAIHDVLAGIALLRAHGVERVALVGHSFGGAVVINAGIVSPVVRAVVGLASQSYGALCVGELSGRPLLLIHGEEDEVLPPSCSETLHRAAGEPKELELLPGAGHVLDEAADAVHDRVRPWLEERLREE